MSGKKITIKDVANAAGVSKGTVDRVVHNRGEVSKESRERVLRVINELGYTPNVHASMLASKKERRFVCLLPESRPGELWSLTEESLLSKAEAAERLNIGLNIIKYDQFDAESFLCACDKAMKLSPSGVILPPIFENETLTFVKRLQAKDIPYIYINSKLKGDKDENSGYLAYFGMPRYLSGYLCADLLTQGKAVRRVCIIRIIRDRDGHSDPTSRRREGFNAYFAEHSSRTAVDNVFVHPNDDKDIDAKISEYMKEHPETMHYAMMNSRVYLVSDYFRRHPNGRIRLVGFDILPRNISALKDGLINVIIAQKIDSETRNAIKCLTDYVIFKRLPDSKDNYTSMDILTKYNCDFY